MFKDKYVTKEEFNEFKKNLGVQFGWDGKLHFEDDTTVGRLYNKVNALVDYLGVDFFTGDKIIVKKIKKGE